MALRQMVATGLNTPVLVFVSTKERAKQLHQELKFERIHCDYLSADQSQAARTAAVQSFRAGKTWMLIATDLIGRGMDFVGVNTVVNYDFPGTKTDYIHRCAAASVLLAISELGCSEHAVTFVGDASPRCVASRWPQGMCTPSKRRATCCGRCSGSIVILANGHGVQFELFMHHHCVQGWADGPGWPQRHRGHLFCRGRCAAAAGHRSVHAQRRLRGARMDAAAETRLRERHHRAHQRPCGC